MKRTVHLTAEQRLKIALEVIEEATGIKPEFIRGDAEAVIQRVECFDLKDVEIKV